MNNIYITDYIDDPIIEREILGDELAKEYNDKIKILLVWHEEINSSYLSKYKELVGIVRYGVGYDLVDLDAIRDNGIIFCNTPDYGVDEVSDTAISMIMNFQRGVYHYDVIAKGINDKSWQENRLHHIQRTSTRKLGIIGAGRIGSSVIRKARSIGFQTFFYDPYKEQGYDKSLGCGRFNSLEELIAESDIISIHADLNNETRGMVDESFLDLAKDGFILINTARGEIFKDLDIIHESLKSEKMYALGTDVLPVEPPTDCLLIDAWRSNESFLNGRLIINPHSAFYSKQAFIEMRKKAAENSLRILNQDMPFNVIASGNKDFLIK